MRFVAVPSLEGQVLLAALLLGLPAAHAQSVTIRDPKWGTWMIGAVVLPGGPRHWGAYAEVQTRANGLAHQYFYYETKGGITYDVAKNVTVMLAGGRYSTSDYRDRGAGPLSVEGRLWQQLTLTQLASRLKLEHRYRVEQRWTRFRNSEVPPGLARYRGRIRYRLNALLPLNHASFSNHTAFLSVYDEVFFDPRGPLFERNRLFAGFGYQLDKHLTVQAGWLNQTNYIPASFQPGPAAPQTNASKHNVLVSFTYRLHRRATDSLPEYVPSQPD